MAAMRGVLEVPAGFVYESELLRSAEEAALLAEFEGMEFESVVMHGQAARRTVRHFGYGYDFDSWRVRPTDPIPASLLDVRTRSAALAGLPAEGFEQALITRYPPGASIGWHRDAAAFGSVVLGVSLGSGCVMRFQRVARSGERRVFEQPLAPRSAYVLAGAARGVWQHSIPALEDLRYSITFRTVRESAQQVVPGDP
jgi:alkylated DNA repair protein (DNA oxidative demethylase)